MQMPAPPPPRREHRIAGGAATGGEGGRGTGTVMARHSLLRKEPLSSPRSSRGGGDSMARHPLLWGAASPSSSAPGGLRAAHGESLFAAAALNTSLIDVATRSTRECPVPAATKRAAPHPTLTHLPGGRGLRHQQWSTAGASDGTAEHLLGLPGGETGLAKGRHRAGLRLSSLKSKVDRKSVV